MKILLILLLYSFTTYANDQGCSNTLHSDLKCLTDLTEQINWEAASVKDIRSAPCKRTTPFTVEEMSAWIKKNQSNEQLSKKINGISFENESPENLKAFQYLTTATNFFGEPDPERQKTFNSKCKKVECAVKEIFGPKSGVQLLFMHQKFGMNGSHLTKVNRSSWKTSELDNVLLTLTDFPPGIFPAEENRFLTHFKRGYLPIYASENTIANASIEVFDLWDQQSRDEKRYALFHELGHNLGGLAGADEDSKWLKMSGWEQTTKVVNGKKVTEYKPKKPETIVSKYAFTNPAEDFAESVAAYRYNPKKLKSISPEKYNFIKEVIFDNVEYTSEQACKNPTRLSDEITSKGNEMIKNWKPTQQDILAAAKKCSATAITTLSKSGNLNVNSDVMTSCYEKAFNDQAADVAKKTFTNSPNSKFLGTILNKIKLTPIPFSKINKFVQEVKPVHRELLKSSLLETVNGYYNFKPDSKLKDLELICYSVPETIGFEPSDKKVEFQNISSKMLQGINNNGSLRRLLGLSISEGEIKDQLDLMIK